MPAGPAPAVDGGVGFVARLGRGAHMPDSSTSPPPTGGGVRRSRRRPRIGVRALGELFQERVHLPVISNAVSVLASSASSCSFLARSFSSSISAAEAPLFDFAARPSRAPAAAALRHSEMCDVYNPSRRRIAPRSSAPFGYESYSARISALYSALNVRLFGRAAGSMSSSVTPPVWARPFNDAVVMVMIQVFLSRPVGSNNRVPQVSHLTLTDRETGVVGALHPGAG